MKRFLPIFLLFFIAQAAIAQTNRLLFVTDYGEFKVMLYDFTPAHRDLILDAIDQEEYKNAFFNRIIEEFVVQGGEHDVDIAAREAAHPDQPKPRLAGEFDKRAIHKVGALGAGRDGNPEKASFLNQIYFITGKPVSPKELDALETKKGVVYTQAQREEYLLRGGQPRLDMDYTIFGEVYEGIDVLLKINQVQTDEQNYPIEPVTFTIIKL